MHLALRYKVCHKEEVSRGNFAKGRKGFVGGGGWGGQKGKQTKDYLKESLTLEGRHS